MESVLSFLGADMEREFKDQLKVLIGQESVRAFALRAGVSDTTLRQYLSGRNEPTLSNLKKIASATGKSLDWLAYGDDAPVHLVGDAKADYVATSVSVSEFDEEFALIRGYHITVSAGPGCSTLDDEQVKRHLAFRKKWLRYRGLSADNLAVVFAQGDSMAPTIQTGDTILIDTSKTQIADGSIFVLRMGDDIYAKRLQKQLDGGVNVISDNKSYPMLTVPAAQMDTLAIIGRVIWVGHDIH